MSYRFMRMMIFFDLPTDTIKDRREYARFRKYLIKSGFVMMQESVYCKLILNQSAVRPAADGIRKNRPPKGLVQMLCVTEKQYAIYCGRRRERRAHNRRKVCGTMMLAHPLLQSPIEFKENRVPVLIVENGQLFRRLIGDLLAQENGEPGEFALSENAGLTDREKRADDAESPFSGTGRTAYSD